MCSNIKNENKCVQSYSIKIYKFVRYSFYLNPNRSGTKSHLIVFSLNNNLYFLNMVNKQENLKKKEKKQTDMKIFYK